ncbi:uncharacterized protein V6R79_014691 [Siganus canaliculatus]
MGGALFSKAWRDVPKDNKDHLDFVKSYKPRNTEVSHLRILLHGPVGAGKSSFINSVDSVLKGRITNRALTDAITGKSFTKKYKTYKLHKDSESVYSFVFNDIMGFEQGTNKGVHVSDIKLILQGHVTEGYAFSPEHLLTTADAGYNSSPTVEDRVHVLVSVIAADTISIINEDIVDKMRQVRLAASDIGIPQLAIITKTDKACPKVEADFKNVYKSKYLKSLVEKFSLQLGLPENCIFLVKNYESEMNTNEDLNALILYALKQMLVFGDDFLNDL